MKKIEIDFVDHKSQRYETLGDYFEEKNILKFKISNVGNSDMNFLILLHEIVEEFLTSRVGITEKKITDFDLDFEAGIIEDSELYSEPGDHPKSPYRESHRVAENIERLIAQEIGLDFNDYDKYLLNFLKTHSLKEENNKKEIDPNIGK